MNLFLHGIQDFSIVRGDTLSHPTFLQNDSLMQFDVVLANPPYSIKQWNRESWSTDPWGRNIYGTPPQSRADYAFLQHIIQSLNTTSGRCAILFPHGVLFRNEEAAMREAFVRDDVIDCVLGLGPNLFYNSPMEACILICRKNRNRKRQQKVLFINAINEVTRERAQSFLTDSHIQRIVSAYRDFHEHSGFSRVVTHDEIAANSFNLSIPLYVRQNSSAADIPHRDRRGDLTDALSRWKASSADVRDSFSKLQCLQEAQLVGKTQ